MLRRFAAIALVGSLLLVAVFPVVAAARQAPATATTVLVTVQAGLDIWMPVSDLIQPDLEGRLYWGQVPIQTFPLPRGAVGHARDHSWFTVATFTPITASAIVADVVNDEAWEVSPNGWLSGPGQMIYYDRREADDCIRGDCRSIRVRFTGLRQSDTIGSIFSPIPAGTKLAPARMYLVGTTARPLQVGVPAGAVLRAKPQ